jgi:hypothetical protein
MNKIVLITAFFVIIMVAPTVQAAPTEVRVSVYVLNVGKFEIATGSYVVDFYLDMKCSVNCSPERFEFMNGRANTMDTLIDTPTEKFYRIQATLSQNMDLKNYPFDVHNLSIDIEDKDSTVDGIVYIASDESGIDPSVIVVGWELGNWSSGVTNHVYETYNETFSRYSFSFEIKRVALTSIIKSFLPVLFMVLIGLLSLFIMADKVTTRLGLNISTLLAAVMFHVNLTSSIPPVGYLTFADKFMLATYIILMVVLASGILLMRHTDLKDDKKAREIYDKSLEFVPLLAVVLYVAVFLFV